MGKAKTKYISFPWFKHILILSRDIGKNLNATEDEIEALLAHEIWHIKKHNITRTILCFLSDYSLFGNGFLTIMQNSYKIEKEADEFALRWLTKKCQDRDESVRVMKSLLEKTEEIYVTKILIQQMNSFGFLNLIDPSSKESFLKKYDKFSRREQLKIDLKLLYQMLFGEEIQCYFHPSNYLRIKWLTEYI